MFYFQLVFISLIYISYIKAIYWNYSIPDDFEFGLATSAYQVEGAWNEDGKGENIWDNLVHSNPSFILDKSNGDIACDSYHKYKEDVQNLKYVGVNYYRFSISWSRVLPTGHLNLINWKGVNYYRNFIIELINNGIKPMVTIYHWDLPQPLQILGGWTSNAIVEYYADYAKFCFEQFGDLVKLWTTFNEPMQICSGYRNGAFAPNVIAPGYGEYLCGHNVILSHARAYHIYEQLFRYRQYGEISFVCDFTWFVPKTNTTDDILAAERARLFYYGWFVWPIVWGDYPTIMKIIIDERSKEEGLGTSRLPKFTLEQKIYIRGTYDFLGVNIYTAGVASHPKRKPRLDEIGFNYDWNVDITKGSDWESSSINIFYITPWAAKDSLRWIKNNFKNPILYVTESGVASNDSSIDDDFRIEYYKEYISNVLIARQRYKVRVKGYTGWSFMDNFEWGSGYTLKFGIFSVDFNSPNRTRTKKKSADYWKSFISTRHL